MGPRVNLNFRLVSACVFTAFVCIKLHAAILSLQSCTSDRWAMGDFTGSFIWDTRKGTRGIHLSHQLKPPDWLFLFFKAPPPWRISSDVSSLYPFLGAAPQLFFPDSLTEMPLHFVMQKAWQSRKLFLLLLFAKLDSGSLEGRVGPILCDLTMPFELLALTSSQGTYQSSYSGGLPKKTGISKNFLYLLTSNIQHFGFCARGTGVILSNESMKEGFPEEVTSESSADGPLWRRMADCLHD